MSFETDKARLVKELVDAQAEIRAHYGLADRSELSTDGSKPNPWAPGKRASAAASGY